MPLRRLSCGTILLVVFFCLFSGKLLSMENFPAQDTTTTPVPTKKALRPNEVEITLETRNEVGSPAPYVTLLTIKEGGVMTFDWRMFQGRVDSMHIKQKERSTSAQLKKVEWEYLKKLVQLKKFRQVQPGHVVFSIYKQGLTVKVGKEEYFLTYQINPDFTNPKVIDEDIYKQLGPKADNIWKFLQAVRSLNSRFRW